MQKKEHRKVNTDFQMPIRIIEVIEYSCTKHEFFSENYKSLLELFAPDTPPATIVMEYFADALVEKINQLSEDQIRAVFDYMERRLVDGDDVVSYSIRAGFLESLVNSDKNGLFDIQRIWNHLGKNSLTFCVENGAR